MDDLTAAQFEEWQAYESLEPWGQDRTQWLLARLTMIVANLMRGSGTQPFTIYDFLPWLEQPPPPTEEELTEKLLAAFGFTPDGQRIESTNGHRQHDRGQPVRPDGAV